MILPLRSVPWQNGTQRTRLGANVYGTGTDLFACHGTSGSGVFQRNALGNLELLGPAKNGHWSQFRLCNDPATITQGTLQMSYERNSIVRQLESAYSWSLFWDRNPIVWVPIDPPVFDPG